MLDQRVKYSSLRYYVRKFNKNNIDYKKSNKKIISITRNQLKKYIFSWKLDKDILRLIEENILPSNAFLRAFKNFYRIFQLVLKEHDASSLKKLLRLESKYFPIQKFIESLRKDYKSVINTAKYEYNNSQVEGQVSKIKRIKHHMYGRAEIKLLKNKAIYQSYFF